MYCIQILTLFQYTSLVDVKKLLTLFVQFGIPQCSTGDGKMDVQCGCGGGDVDSHSVVVVGGMEEKKEGDGDRVVLGLNDFSRKLGGGESLSELSEAELNLNFSFICFQV